MKYFYLALLCASCCTVSFAQNMRMVAIGSSTTGGTGANPADSAWVNRFTYYYKNQLGIVDIVYNLGWGGSSCYRGMPSSYSPPAGREGPDPFNNVSRAVTLLSGMAIPANGVVIVNYPTNGYITYSIAEIMNCLQVIYDSATRLGNKCYITTTQPRNDAGFNNPVIKRKLADIKDSIINRFSVGNTINFWDGMFNPSDTSILPIYAAGDNIHFNNAGHRVLFERVKAKNVFSAILPIKLQQFTGTIQDKKVILKWTVDQDDPAGSFTIQRSANGQDFESLHQQPVTNQAGTHTYTFTDQTLLPGTSYYRLAIRERDHTDYSKTVTIKAALPALTIKRLYPIPVTKRLLLELVAEKAQPITIDIITSGGMLIQRTARQITNGINYLNVPVAQLATGMYYVRINCAGNEPLIRAFNK
ncbi:hypothetical protein D3H65_22270 [Paraflavitalea soli]|uniref:T9SS C-terminal target domain-containing protein n=1 Tax=Paraflavitalea soli TaxID=2315862 RepID=A0A3B7MXW8_9BACT|nr:hypothetical protein [Paraflavitalea soli]AXY76555.1 hypothetical protein D3H65_22270 [Paraflavitalea soli]